MIEKEKKEMTIKEFCKEYSNRIDKLRGDYLKENLKITTYIPFIKKDELAQNIVNATTYNFENYTKEDGTTGRRITNQIHINSTAQMLLFYRVIIENYTNLEVETEGFYEEYDALNESGVLAELVSDYEGHPSLIPISELTEFKTLIKMKQEDIFTNYSNPQNYIANQIERISKISTEITPALNMIANQFKDMDATKLEKLGNIFQGGFGVIK